MALKGAIGMSTPQDMVRDLSTAAFKSAPPLTVYALTLNEWLAVASIVYILAQLAHLLWRWTREWRHAKRNRQAAELAAERLKAP